MKRLFLFFFLLAFAFGIGFAASRWDPFKQEQESVESLLGQQFPPIPHTLRDHFFTIIVSGHNNGGSVQKTLNSLFFQKYENFRIIYIDDASDDGSFELARDLIFDSERMHLVSIVHNEERLGELGSLAKAIQTCPDDEIVVIVGGDDWLAHEWVLEKLNQYYADPDLWLTYGQSIDFPSFSRGNSRAFAKAEVDENGFRSHPFISSHLKTFYASLFKKIDESDFLFQGAYLPVHADMAYMIPMLEMAKDHFQCIQEILYVCNKQKQKKEDRDLGVRMERFIRSLNPYIELTKL